MYIQLQVQIYDLGYQSERNKAQLQELTDHRNQLASSILTLKSSSHMGIKLLSEKSQMQFLDNKNIVKLTTPPRVLKTAKSDLTKKQNVQRPEKGLRLLAGALSLHSQAEAGLVR